MGINENSVLSFNFPINLDFINTKLIILKKVDVSGGHGSFQLKIINYEKKRTFFYHDCLCYIGFHRLDPRQQRHIEKL